jgi:hypothetical protein
MSYIRADIPAMTVIPNKKLQESKSIGMRPLFEWVQFTTDNDRVRPPPAL